MFFCFYKILFFVADLLKIQRKSFYTFLSQGLIQQLEQKKVFFSTHQQVKIILLSKYYQLVEPNYGIYQAILQSKTFGCKLFIPVL
uniref:Beta subunit of RNA polymerase n=1 Tax=Bryopsis plumosa TaxID=3130 RepID=A0A0D6E1C5_BRYPL|nr:beta subunit of RNA polymerase [Bryopsis plumosa]CEO91009.1 beta subunit of RNA polymerase [Bryopsis plumosa]